MIVGPVFPACQIISFYIGVTQLCFMSAPIGDCLHCCPRDDDVDIQYELNTSGLCTTLAITSRIGMYLPIHSPEFIRSNPTMLQTIMLGDVAGLSRSNFQLSNPTVIYVMGFSEATTGASTIAMRDAFLSAGDYNFIAVNWARLIAFPWYATAVRNTRYMGVRLADFIQFLARAGLDPTQLHIVGFSLGAEAAGFAGKELRRRGMRLGRITGLDPAYPGYRLSSSDGHLSSGDAIFVDIIHTNPGIFGFPNPIGDVDFYPNHGYWIQPGCWVDQLFRNSELQFVYGCSHSRSWRYFIESLSNPTGFPATLCKDWKSRTRNCDYRVDGYMGIAARRPMVGKMFLQTNQRPPFAKNGP